MTVQPVQLSHYCYERRCAEAVYQFIEGATDTDFARLRMEAMLETTHSPPCVHTVYPDSHIK